MDSRNRHRMFSSNSKETEKVDTFSLTPYMLDYLLTELELIKIKSDKINHNNKKWYKFKIGNNYQGLEFIIRNAIERIQGSVTDVEAQQKLIKFFFSLPVQPDNQSVQTFVHFLGAVSENVELQEIPGGPLTGDYLTFLNNCYQYFIETYQYQLPWEFSYLPNHNGEVLIPEFLKFQTEMSNVNYAPDAAYRDFMRDFKLGGMDNRHCYLVSLPSMEDTDSLKKSKYPYLIHTSNPDAVYCYLNSNTIQDKFLIKELTSDAQSKEFDMLQGGHKIKKFTAAKGEMAALSRIINFVKMVKTVEQINGESIEKTEMILTPIQDIFIDREIDSLVNQLNDKHADQLKAWLKMAGGQALSTVLNIPLAESHFGKMLALNETKQHIVRWTIKDNQLTFICKADLISMTDGDLLYVKSPNNPFISSFSQNSNLDLFDEIKNKKNPLLSAYVEVGLMVDAEGKVKPQIKVFDIVCSASWTESGELLLQSPKNNARLMSQLPEKPEQTLSSDEHKGPRF